MRIFRDTDDNNNYYYDSDNDGGDDEFQLIFLKPLSLILALCSNCYLTPCVYVI